MSSFSKKILSAFVEVGEDKDVEGNGAKVPKAGEAVSAAEKLPPGREGGDDRFRNHFDKLFEDANIKGPDYFEFSKMTDAMRAIADEQARYCAAFAGLQVQGLDKARLLSTAEEYLRVLASDADRFHATVNTATQEKVRDRQAQLAQKAERIRALTEEITGLQQEIVALQAEIHDNEGKIEANTAGYAAESGERQSRILSDIEKIKRYVQ
jgi:hypothetical protein